MKIDHEKYPRLRVLNRSVGTPHDKKFLEADSEFLSLSRHQRAEHTPALTHTGPVMPQPRTRSLACLTLLLLALIVVCVEATRVPATAAFEDWNDERLEATLFETSAGLTAAPVTAEPSPASAVNEAPIKSATIPLTQRGATLLESGVAPATAATAAPTNAAIPTPTAVPTHAATHAATPTPATAASTAAPTVAATKAPSKGAAGSSPIKSKTKKSTHECVVPTDRVSTFAALRKPNLTHALLIFVCKSSHTYRLCIYPRTASNCTGKTRFTLLHHCSGPSRH